MLPIPFALYGHPLDTAPGYTARRQSGSHSLWAWTTRPRIGSEKARRSW